MAPRSTFMAIVATLLVPVTARAQDERSSVAARPELAVGILAHGVSLFEDKLPPGLIFEGTEERGTADLQIVYRSAPLKAALKPRLTARLQINTDGRTSFASVGAEWRQHILHGRVYGQTGIGVTIHDGYRYLPDPFASGLTAAEAMRRYRIYEGRTGFGSRILFNPNLSAGLRLDRHNAIEIAYEHFSHKQVFSKQNPGIDTIGLRFVRMLGGT